MERPPSRLVLHGLLDASSLRARGSPPLLVGDLSIPGLAVAGHNTEGDFGSEGPAMVWSQLRLKPSPGPSSSLPPTAPPPRSRTLTKTVNPARRLASTMSPSTGLSPLLMTGMVGVQAGARRHEPQKLQPPGCSGISSMNAWHSHPPASQLKLSRSSHSDSTRTYRVPLPQTSGLRESQPL